MATPLDVEALLAEATWVRRLVRGLVQDGAAVDDVLQETWLAALRADGRLAGRGPSGLRAWLAAVARNLALRARRDAAVRARHEGEARGRGASDEPERELARLRLHERLAQALGELEEAPRSALIQRYLDELSYEEIARRAGITAEAARQRVSRGLARLRARLEREYGSGEGFGAALVAVLVPRGAEGILLGGALVGTKVAAGIVGAAAVAGIAAFLVVQGEEPGPAVAGERAPPEGGALAALQAQAAPASPLAPPATAGQDEQPRAAREELAPGARALVLFVTDVRGRPLGDAWVALAGAPEEERRRTDARGRVELALAQPLGRGESLDVAAGCDGYVEAREAVAPGRGGIVLHELPTVRVRLVDPEGQRVTAPGEVTLGIAAAEPQGGEYLASGLWAPRSRVDRPAVLDPSGEFVAAHVPVGKVISVHAMVRGFVETNQELERELVPDAVEELEFALDPGVVVTGVVLDDPSGQPLPGARVWADAFNYDPDALTPHTLADDRGRYRLEGVVAEKQWVEGEKEYVTLGVVAADDQHAPAKARWILSTWEPDRTYEVELRLDPSDCALEGTVFRAGGRDPASGVLVYALIELGDLRLASTGADGHFHFDGLLPGDVTLSCVPTSLETEIGGVVATYTATLEAGTTHTCAIELPETSLAGVSGRVLDLQERPVRDARIRAECSAGGKSIFVGLGTRAVLTDEEGRFEFRSLPTGASILWTLYVDAPGADLGCERPESYAFTLGEEEQLDQRDFVVGPCIALAGNVAPAGHDLARLRVRLVDPRTGERLTQTGLEEDASFVLRDVLAGVYELVLVDEDVELASERVGPDGAAGLWLRAR